MARSKWSQITAGVEEVITQTSGTVNWGLKLFGSDGCGVTPDVEIPIASNNAGAVNAAIEAAEPDSSTPTRQAVNVGVEYMRTLTDPNPKFLLLATDGQPTCLDLTSGGGPGTDDPMAVEAVTAAAAAGFPTFVVGIATAGSTNADTVLRNMAREGGQARLEDPPYYPVSTRDQLVTALGAITKAAASCTLSLATAPPDPANVGVRVQGDNRIPRDTTHTDGWDYGAGMQSIILYGSYCDSVTAGTYTDVRALFGCPGIKID